MIPISDPNAVLRAEAQYVDGKWFVSLSGNNDVLNSLYEHRWIYHVFNGQDTIVNKMSIVFCAESPEAHNESSVNEAYDPDCSCATCRLVRVKAEHKREVGILTREKQELEGNAKYWQERAYQWQDTAKTIGNENENLIAVNRYLQSENKTLRDKGTLAERNKELETQIAQMYSDYKVFLDGYKRDLEKMVGLYTTIRVLSGLIQQ